MFFQKSHINHSDPKMDGVTSILTEPWYNLSQRFLAPAISKPGGAFLCPVVLPGVGSLGVDDFEIFSSRLADEFSSHQCMCQRTCLVGGQVTARKVTPFGGSKFCRHIGPNIAKIVFI